jgi:hypothetical protein
MLDTREADRPITGEWVSSGQEAARRRTPAFRNGDGLKIQVTPAADGQ